MEQFEKLAKQIAEERYPEPKWLVGELPHKHNRKLSEEYFRREAYEACINECVKPLITALKEIQSNCSKDGIYHIICTQAIANFEGGVKEIS